ncbi:MAG TPA: YafY family protein [Pseudonocardiaceae bacterium]|nr:YafY family protein [Pseudonocardiaceae bacterium]
MRASRLLSTLLLLQNRGRMTATELADELEVSVRTVYRDVESLSSAGVPVYADRGPSGGYRLLDGYRTKLTGLTSEEADTLFLAGVPDAAAELGLGAELAAAQLKLEASLAPELRERAARIRQRFHLDAPSWFRELDAVPHLAATAAAVWNQQRIRIRYHGAGSKPKESRTELDPLGVVCKAGVWYLVAACGGKARTYRVGRVLELETLPERFHRPADFDLVEFWRDWVKHYEDGVYQADMLVRLSPTGYQMITWLWMSFAARATMTAAQPPEADGWRRPVVPIESVRHAFAEVLKLGKEIEVLEPVELRAMVREAAAALNDMYADAPALDDSTLDDAAFEDPAPSG